MKPLFVISCPIDTYSGYGARARDIVKALLKSEKYEVKILPQRWGNTSFGFLKSDNPEHKVILDCILKDNNLPKQPDIWAQLTVPNEFQAIGKFNIGITAGIETTICAPEWIEGMNRMNLNLVSSNHAKTVFQNSKFEKRNTQTKQLESIIELKSPVEVLFEGVDTNIYKKLDLPQIDIGENELYDNIDDIPEKFAFLFVGHWLQGDLGQDRKDVGMLIKTFLETFKNKPIKPALILKTSGATASIMDRDDMLSKIQSIRIMVGGENLPNVYLLHGEFSDEEINELYNHPKIKAFVSFTKGEGYGRPLLEASITQKPIIASNWSGHTDFLSSEMSVLLSGQITQLHPSAVVKDMLLAESGWFTVDYDKASKILEDVYKKYDKFLDGAKKQSYRSRTEFSLDKMEELLIDILDKNVPKPLELKLPQLKKIELPKLTKVS
jgi:glycosyltransferase involved in cell wall biosynthesis